MPLYRTDAPGPGPIGEVPELAAIERRVLGVLIEKALTTPEYYPLTLKAIVSGCNQRSNRDPITSYAEDEVEDCLETLQKRRLAKAVLPDTGRAMRYRHEAGIALELDGAQLAVVAELLLRGAQAEGELRARAARMKPIPDQTKLREILEELSSRSLPLLVRLSPPDQQRGRPLVPLAERRPRARHRRGRGAGGSTGGGCSVIARCPSHGDRPPSHRSPVRPARSSQRVVPRRWRLAWPSWKRSFNDWKRESIGSSRANDPEIGGRSPNAQEPAPRPTDDPSLSSRVTHAGRGAPAAPSSRSTRAIRRSSA